MGNKIFVSDATVTTTTGEIGGSDRVPPSVRGLPCRSVEDVDVVTGPFSLVGRRGPGLVEVAGTEAHVHAGRVCGSDPS